MKVVNLISARDIWTRLESIYEGNDKVKQAKMLNLKIIFENLQMFKDENITSYIQKVDKVVNTIKGLGGKLKEEVIKKVLINLPKYYSHKF